MSEVHVYRGTGTRFIARIRGRGERKCALIGKPRMTSHAAASAAVKALYMNDWALHADVIMVADWYEPHVVFESRKRD